MACFCRVVILMITVCCTFTSGFLQCKPSCDVNEALGCQVKYIGPRCKSTALASSLVWPGKAKDLSFNQFIPVDSGHQDEVGYNISWRMPNDGSALNVTGFEITLRLAGFPVQGIKNCYVMSLNSSQIGLDQLLRTVFSMECYVTRKAEGVVTVLYALPQPPKRPNPKRVLKYNEIIVPTTQPNNPCIDDPGITATITKDGKTQLVVTLRSYQRNSSYIIMLVQGTYEKAKQIIQPDNRAGRWKAVFEDSKLLTPDECYYVWAVLTTCHLRDGVWSPRNKFCIPTTTTTTILPTVTTLMHAGKSPQTERQTSEKEEVALPTSTIIIVGAFGALGIILLGVLSLFFIMRKKQRCPNPVLYYDGYRQVQAGLNNEGVKNESPPPQPQKVKQLVVVYDIGNCKSVRRFIEYLKKICPDLHIYDFVDVDAVEENPGSWFLKVSGKAVSDGGRLLYIYSDGLMKLMEAATKQMCHPGYEEKVHSGEHMSRFLSLMQNRLFFTNNPKVYECVISLGEDIHPEFHRVLVHFSGVKLNLFEWCNKELSIHERNTTDFLKMLPVNDVDGALADPLLTEVLTKTQDILTNQTDPDWFIKLYGNPELISARGEDDPTTDSSFVDSSSTGSNSDERSIRLSMEELRYGGDMSSDRCPPDVVFIPPECLNEDDSSA